MDAVPIRPFWLDQFILEVLEYPRAAIRGSPYRGAKQNVQSSHDFEGYCHGSNSYHFVGFNSMLFGMLQLTITTAWVRVFILEQKVFRR